MSKDVVSEEEYWKRRKAVESQEGGGTIFCWHAWVTEIEGETVLVKYVRPFGSTIQISGIPKLVKCIKCGRRELRSEGLRGLQDSV